MNVFQVALSKEYRRNEILAKCKDPEIAQKKSEQVREIPKEDAYFQIFTGNLLFNVSC